MSVSVECCGRSFKYDDWMAGRQFRCALCGQVKTINQPDVGANPRPRSVSPGQSAPQAAPEPRDADDAVDPEDMLPVDGARRPRRPTPAAYEAGRLVNSIETDFPARQSSGGLGGKPTIEHVAALHGAQVNMSPEEDEGRIASRRGPRTLDPRLPLVLFVLLQNIIAITGIRGLGALARSDAGSMIFWVADIVQLVLLFALVGPATWLGLFAASRLGRREMPERSYLFACGLAAAPAIVCAAARFLPSHSAYAWAVLGAAGMVFASLVWTWFAPRIAEAILIVLLTGPLYAIGQVGANVIVGLIVGEIQNLPRELLASRASVFPAAGAMDFLNAAAERAAHEPSINPPAVVSEPASKSAPPNQVAQSSGQTHEVAQDPPAPEGATQGLRPSTMSSQPAGASEAAAPATQETQVAGAEKLHELLNERAATRPGAPLADLLGLPLTRPATQPKDVLAAIQAAAARTQPAARAGDLSAVLPAGAPPAPEGTASAIARPGMRTSPTTQPLLSALTLTTHPATRPDTKAIGGIDVVSTAQTQPFPATLPSLADARVPTTAPQVPRTAFAQTQPNDWRQRLARKPSKPSGPSEAERAARLAELQSDPRYQKAVAERKKTAARLYEESWACNLAELDSSPALVSANAEDLRAISRIRELEEAALSTSPATLPSSATTTDVAPGSATRRTP